MMKRIVLAVIAVFVLWQVLDFVIHGLILMKTYEATPSLWRPMPERKMGLMRLVGTDSSGPDRRDRMPEMKMGLMRLVGLLTTTAFVCLYAWLIRDKSVATGLSYGLVFGVGTGLSMGFGTYCVMPIPLFLAVVWCVGTIVETALGGLLVGWIVKDPEPRDDSSVTTKA